MMAPFLQKLFFPLIALASLTWPPSTAHSEEVLKLIPGFAMTINVPDAESFDKLSAIVGDTEIADFTFAGKNTFILVGRKEGSTNIVVIENEGGTELFTATLQVGAGKQVSTRVYVGQPDSRGYVCSITNCVPSETSTVTSPSASPSPNPNRSDSTKSASQ
jgi:Flp pilus assembly secretin CpaC